MYEQIARLLRRGPFRPFTMLFVDGRSVTVTNIDFVSLLGDGTGLIVYTLPDDVEIFALAKVVSLKFREPDLMLELESDDL